MEFGFWQSIGLKIGTREDAGPVDFATLERRTSPNDSLICAAELCPRARADAVVPVFSLSPADLHERLRAVVLAEPRTLELAGAGESHLRFVQRSFLLRYPDIIDVLVAPRGENASALALYSRSLVGRRDFGVNRARLERWLAALSK